MANLFPTDRIPGVDLATEQLALAAQAGRVESLFLGWSGDHTPLFLVGQKGGEGKPQLLLIGAPQGDCVIGIAAACQILLEPSPELDEWQIWALAALDVTRLRQNVTQLGQILPSPGEHLRARRQPWAPGEKPELNLPFNTEGYLQPDSYPEQGALEDVVPCTPESLALARALHHLNPSLVVSLADQSVGTGKLACSQELHPTDQVALIQALCPGGEFEVLEPLGEPEPESLKLGGVAIWQWLAKHHPDAVYLSAQPGRFAYPQISEQPILRDLELSYQMRNLSGGEKMVGIHKLVRPQHPAHELEVLVRPVGDEENIPSGMLSSQTATAGMIAIESLAERQALLAKVLDCFAEAADNLQGDDFPRALRILQTAAKVDDDVRRYATQTQYMSAPSTEQLAYWQFDYPWETAAMLAETLRCLEEESSIDKKIVALRKVVDECINQILEDMQELQPQSISGIVDGMQALIIAASEVCFSGRPALLRCERKIELLEEQSVRLQKLARNAKLLGHPRSEQQVARQAADDAKQALAEAQAELQELQVSVEEQPVVAQPTEPAEAVVPVEELVVADAPASQLVVADAPASQLVVADAPASQLVVADAPASQLVSSPSSDAEELVAADSPASQLVVPNEPEETAGAAEGVEIVVEDPAEAEIEESVDTPDSETEEPVATESSDAEELVLPNEPTETPTSPTPVESEAEAVEELSAPELPPMPEPIRPEPVVVEVIEEEEKEEIDIEALMPFKLEIPREWGHGTLHWEGQIPRMGEQPLLRSMLKKLMKRGRPADWYMQALPQGELEETPKVGTELQEPIQPGTVGLTRATAVSFIRHRINADQRFEMQNYEPVTIPFPASPGAFTYRPKRRLDSQDQQ